jgi:uncharacterized protein with PQ loop repeat
MLLAEVFYSCGCTIMNIAMWPQLRKTYLTKKVADLSLYTLTIILVEHVPIIWWTLWKHAWIGTLVNCTTFVLFSFQLYMCLKYRRRNDGEDADR